MLNQTSVTIDRHGWPVWPQPSRRICELLTSVVKSSRWSISTFDTGTPSYERAFAEAYAALHRVAHCIPTANGTAALQCALAALGIGANDEVIVPGLTWVALAVAPLSLNAIPIPVDVDSDSLCISPKSIEAALTPRTRAIIVVHLYCSVAAIRDIVELGRRFDVPVIEDCAQSHGSLFDGQMVGTFAQAGAFSFHQGKPLPAGEGGCVITSDPALACTVEQLRANGRAAKTGDIPEGTFALQEKGDHLGTNFAMSEFNAAVALAGTESLEQQLAIQGSAADFLRSELRLVRGLSVPVRSPLVSRQTYYQFAVRFDPSAFGGLSAAVLAERLSATLCCPWERTYVPLTRHPLIRAVHHKRFAIGQAFQDTIRPGRQALPVCEAIHSTTVVVHHRILLSPRSMLQRIPEAFQQIQRDGLSHSLTGDFE